ncbi:hypothetical protein LCGC14_2987850, partial [marine sediment metagenome]
NWYQPMKLPSELQEFLDDERGALGLGPEEITPAFSTELKQKLATLQESFTPEQVAVFRRWDVGIPPGTEGVPAALQPVTRQEVINVLGQEIIRSAKSEIRAEFGETMTVYRSGFVGAEGLTSVTPSLKIAQDFWRGRAAAEAVETFVIDVADVQGFGNIRENELFVDVKDLRGGVPEPTGPVTPEVPAPTAEEAAAEPEAPSGAKQPWQMTFRELVSHTRGDALGTPERAMVARFLRDYGESVGYVYPHPFDPNEKITTTFTSQAQHEAIEKAQGEGRSIPPEVLNDYPDLKPSLAPIKPKTVPSARPDVVAKRKRNRTGVPKRSKQDVAAIVSAFTTYLNSPTTANAMALTEKLRTEERSKRIMRFT